MLGKQGCIDHGDGVLTREVCSLAVEPRNTGVAYRVPARLPPNGSGKVPQ